MGFLKLIKPCISWFPPKFSRDSWLSGQFFRDSGPILVSTTGAATWAECWVAVREIPPKICWLPCNGTGPHKIYWLLCPWDRVKGIGSGRRCPYKCESAKERVTTQLLCKSICFELSALISVGLSELLILPPRLCSKWSPGEKCNYTQKVSVAFVFNGNFNTKNIYFWFWGNLIILFDVNNN